MKARKFDKAILAVDKRYAKSLKLAEKLESQLLKAKARFQKGDEANALASFKKISEKATIHKRKVGWDSWMNLVGETNIILATELRREFDELEPAKNYDPMQRIARKMEIYERLERFYKKAIATKHPEYATMARFKLAEAGFSLSNQIINLALEDHRAPTVKTFTRYHEKAKLYTNQAKKYLSDNV